MIMFLITLVTVFIMSLLYNGFLSIGGDATSQYRISDLMGVSNDIFMKAAACGTWCGDFFTAWMVRYMYMTRKMLKHGTFYSKSSESLSDKEISLKS